MAVSRRHFTLWAASASALAAETACAVPPDTIPLISVPITCQPWQLDIRTNLTFVGDLTPFQTAGAVDVMLAWTDVSDPNAANQ